MDLRSMLSRLLQVGLESLGLPTTVAAGPDDGRVRCRDPPHGSRGVLPRSEPRVSNLPAEGEPAREEHAELATEDGRHDAVHEEVEGRAARPRPQNFFCRKCVKTISTVRIQPDTRCAYVFMFVKIKINEREAEFGVHKKLH